MVRAAKYGDVGLWERKHTTHDSLAIALASVAIALATAVAIALAATAPASVSLAIDLALAAVVKREAGPNKRRFFGFENHCNTEILSAQKCVTRGRFLALKSAALPFSAQSAIQVAAFRL